MRQVEEKLEAREHTQRVARRVCLVLARKHIGKKVNRLLVRLFRLQ